MEGPRWGWILSRMFGSWSRRVTRRRLLASRSSGSWGGYIPLLAGSHSWIGRRPAWRRCRHCARCLPACRCNDSLLSPRLPLRLPSPPIVVIFPSNSGEHVEQHRADRFEHACGEFVGAGRRHRPRGRPIERDDGYRVLPSRPGASAGTETGEPVNSTCSFSRTSPGCAS